jgi:PAS domain S-box-containing protein
MPKILAIDDKQDNLITISALLRNFIPDCTVITSGSGAEGIKKVKADQPDTILLDIKMPGMDGYEVCKKLKSDEKTKHIPVIMLTAIKTDSESRVKGFKLGADAFLFKPIDETELAAQIKVMLRIKKAEDTLRKEKNLLEVTVRERTKSLRESEEKYRNLFENVEVGMYITKIDGTSCLAANRKFAEILGKPIEELLANPAFDHWENPTDREELVRQLMQEGSVSGYEFRLVAQNGDIKTCLLSGKVFGDNGTYEGSLVDITERKKAEKERVNLIYELQQALSEVKTLSTLSETVNKSLNLDLVMDEALEKIMELFKPHSTFIRLLDNDAQELVLTIQKGLSSEELDIMRKRLKLEEAVSATAFQTGEAMVIEDVFSDPRTKGKNSLCENIGCQTLVVIPLYSKRKPLGHLSILERKPSAFSADHVRLFSAIGHEIGTAIENASLYRDMEAMIKELHETRDKLLQSQKMEAIGTLAGGIAHDFNNILFPIMGYTEMLLEDTDKSSPNYGPLNEIFTATKRASELVKQILAFSREKNQELKPLKVQYIIKEIIKLVRSGLPQTIAIRQTIANETPLVMADPTQIHQVLMNLMTNAYHAMEENGGTLDISLSEVLLGANNERVPDLPPGEYVCLNVQDTGDGMDAQTMERIFDPYFSTKGVGKGTGMGLAIVHGIVKSHGGGIQVQSEPDKGSTFTVYLPALKTTAKDAHTVAERAIIGGTERILLVDDEEPIVRIEQQLLERLGYQVTARTSSVEALEAFIANPDSFDLIVTDMTMPNMTGIQLARKVKKIVTIQRILRLYYHLHKKIGQLAIKQQIQCMA